VAEDLVLAVAVEVEARTRLDPAWLTKPDLDAVAVDLVNNSLGGPVICRPGRVMVDAVDGDGLAAPDLAAARDRGPTDTVVPGRAAVGLRAVGPVTGLGADRGGEIGRRDSGADTDLEDEASEAVEADAEGPRRSRRRPFPSEVTLAGGWVGQMADREAVVVRETEEADDRTDAASDSDKAREVVRGREGPPRRFRMNGDMEEDPRSSSSGTLISEEVSRDSQPRLVTTTCRH
jgi:hypothetical protein